MKKRRTWLDKLPATIRRHLTSDAGVRSLAALRRTVEWQSANGVDCWECRRALAIAAALRRQHLTRAWVRLAAERGETWGRS
jgi:hypothetical protein